jgi:hypothetical protein
VSWLWNHYTGPITIIDNDSTYPPLLEYYKELSTTSVAKVYYTGKNCGPHIFWNRQAINGGRPHLLDKNRLDEIKGEGLNWHLKQSTPYLYTDSDCVPSKDCPNDLIPHMLELLEKFPNCKKVGAGLRIDNIPDCFHNKQKVIKAECIYYAHRLPGYARSPVDTTLALYPPYGEFSCNWDNIRTLSPYLIEHAGWYTDSENLSEEEKYYREHVWSWWKDCSYSL